MLKVMHSRSLPYSIAVLTITLALLLKLLLDRLIEPESMLLLFFVAVMVSAYYGGWKSGMLATGLATLSSVYFLLWSSDVSWAHSLIHHLQLVLFVLQGGLISVLMGALHKAKHTAEVSASKLLEREELLRQLTENIREVFWVFSPEKNQILYVSSAYEEIWGRSCADLYETPSSFLDTIHPEDRDRVILARNKQVQGEYQQEYRIVQPDGSVRWIKSRVFPIRNSLGQVYRLAGISEDITNHQQTQAELRRANERFQLAATAANCIIYDWDIQKNTVDRALGFAQLLGYAPQEVEPTSNWWQECIHPDDRQRAHDKVWQALMNPEVSRFESEYRVRNKQGSYLYVCDRGIIIRNSSGSAIRAVGCSLNLSDRKRVEEELYRREQEFKALAENSPDIISRIDQQLRHVYVSPAIETVTGLSPQALIGKTHPELGMPQDQSLEWQRIVREVFDTKQERISEFNFSAPDGTIRYYQLRTVPEFAQDGSVESVLGVARDITDLKQIEAALRDSETKFRRLVESNIIGVIFWDITGNILDANDAFLEMVGYTREDLQAGQLRWKEMTPVEQLNLSEQSIAQMQQIGAASYEKEYICKDGRLVSALIGGVMFEGSFERGVSFVLDLTELKRSQEELAQSLKREQAARAESEVARTTAESANRIKDEFLAVLSHELRSPLNPILGWSKLLRTGKLDEATTARALETIERNAKLQTQLIEDLLDVSRILQGKLNLTISPVNLASIIEAALDTVRLAAQTKSIQIQTVFEPNMGLVSGDANRLQQVAWNLLSNAVKFTPQGGRVEVRLSAVFDRAYAQNELGHPASVSSESQGITNNEQPTTNNYAQITVSDTGKGINPEFLPHVFDYFRQESSATTRAFGGLGLGLAIVRHLVELHGGTVWAESSGEGQGATFTVRLPLMTVYPQINQDDAQSDHPPDLSELRVLVVDDEADMREFLAFTLKKYGAHATVVASAGEALDILAKSKPDLLLSDIGMSGMDGYMLIRQIRAMPPEQGGLICAIALTAYATEADHQQALSAGFHMHITKPVDPMALVKAIAQLVKQPNNIE
jgi:hypothetical protein